MPRLRALLARHRARRHANTKTRNTCHEQRPDREDGDVDGNESDCEERKGGGDAKEDKDRGGEKEKPSAAVPHLSVAERVARGKAARQEVPRAAHASFESLSSRPDPVKLLQRQAKTRVPELVPIRYGRMLVSPFTFYRGATSIMAHDLAATPRWG